MSKRNGLQKVVLADVPFGSIVRHQGRWGVVCWAPTGMRHAWQTRVVDFWDGGMEYVKDTTVVDVAPNKHGAAA